MPRMINAQTKIDALAPTDAIVATVLSGDI